MIPNIRALTSELSRLNATADRKLENAKKWRRIAYAASFSVTAAIIGAFLTSGFWPYGLGYIAFIGMLVEAWANICARRCEAMSWHATGRIDGLTTAMTMTTSVTSMAPGDVRREERPN